MSKLFVDEIVHQSSQGSGTITLGASGEKITTATGAEFSNVSGQNYPAFEAYLSASQNISDNAQNKILFDTEKFDTNDCYDNVTNHRFTPNVAGKYLFFASFAGNTSAITQLRDIFIQLRKNGSAIASYYSDFNANYITTFIPNFVTTDEANGTTDYYEIYARVDTQDASVAIISGGDNKQTKFGAYRLGA